VRKRQRRLSDVDAVVLDTVSRITDAVIEEMQAWTTRPLLPIYAAVFIDAIHLIWTAHVR
jgi:transposase-like protein